MQGRNSLPFWACIAAGTVLIIVALVKFLFPATEAELTNWWYALPLALAAFAAAVFIRRDAKRQEEAAAQQRRDQEIRARNAELDRQNAAERTRQEERAAGQRYQHCLELYTQLQTFPEYSSFRREGPPEALSQYAALCRDMSGALAAAAEAPFFYIVHPRLHIEKPFGNSAYVHSSAEEYMQDRIRFFSGRAGYAAEASAQMVEFVQVLETLPEAEILISEAPAPELPPAEISYSTITKRTPRDKLGNFVVIDTETTGLSIRASIVEIAAIRFRGFRPVEKFTTLCHPKGKISEDASKINGITEEMVAGKPPFSCIAAGLQAFIGKDDIVGHNLPFDMKFITKYGVDTTLSKRKYYDTLEIAKHTLKKWREGSEAYYDVFDYKLSTLCDYYHIPFFGAHRALADCYATGMLLERLAKDRE